MKHPFLNLAGVALLAAGMALGQGPAQKPPRMGPHAGQARQGTMVDRLATELNLTADQKQKAETIFGAAREQAAPIRSQIREKRMALETAMKSNSEADIDQISTAMCPLMAQATAIRTKAFAKFYQILTPDQKAKMDQRFENMMNRWQSEHGRP